MEGNDYKKELQTSIIIIIIILIRCFFFYFNVLVQQLQEPITESAQV
jgi:hypothetical protein